MNFWNNPAYASIRTIIILSVVIFGGYFAFIFSGNSSSSQAGSILEATRDTESLGTGVTTETVMELNEEIERLNSVRTSDAWYIGERRKRKAEESLVETLEIRSEVIGNLATDGETVDEAEIALSEDLVAALPEIVQEEIETPETITGELYTEHVDDFENPENSYFRSFVITDDGKRYDILPTEEISFARATVTVSGKISGETFIGDPEPIKIKDTIHKHSHANAKIVLPDTETIGEVTNKIALFLVNYSDDSADISPFTPEEAEAIFFDGQMNNFYKEQSYNKFKFDGDVFGWYTIPRISDPCKVDIEDELASFIIENDIDLSSYDHLLVYNDCGEDADISPSFSTIGDAEIDIDGSEYEISYAQIISSSDSKHLQEDYNSFTRPFPWTDLDNVLAHELGHSIGLAHAQGMDCGSEVYNSFGLECVLEDYGNFFDRMGTGKIAFHFNAWSKARLGWLDSTNVVTITASGTYTIGVLEEMSSQKSILNFKNASKKYAVIRSPNPLEESIIYLVEYRKGIGFDSTLNSKGLLSNTRGVLVYKMKHEDHTVGIEVEEYENVSPQLISMRATDDIWSFDAEKAALIGETVFYDEANNISIGPILSYTENNVSFAVNMPDILCERKQPEIYLDPEEEYEYEASELDNAINLLFVNTDNAFCGDSPEFDYTIDPSSLGLIGGAMDLNDHKRIRVDSTDRLYLDIDGLYDLVDPDDILPGVYPITVTATNLTSGMTSAPFTFNLTVE